MAGNIKGITIEIGGNTAPLDKALSDVNKKSRSLQVELRQVEKLLRFDPGNTELIAQKQQLLQQAIQGTEEKLETLKTAQQQVQAQFARGEVTEEQYRALTREVARTEQELSRLKGATTEVARATEAEERATREAEEALRQHTEEVERARQEVGEYGEKLKSTAGEVGSGMLKMGAATVAAGGFALKFSTDFDQALNQLQAKTGSANQEMVGLEKSMENIYKNGFGENIEDVAQSMATVKINTALVGEELEKTTEYAMLLSDTFDMDINESTRSAKMLMDQFGLSSKESYNLIAQGAQAGLDKNGDLLDTINEYSVQFKGLGYGAEDMFNMLVNGAASGTWSVDKLGDAVKEFNIRAKDGSKSTAEAFQTLGLDVDSTTKKFGEGGASARQAMNEVTTSLFNMKDPIAQNSAGVALFGTMWEDLGADGVKALMDTQWEIDKTNSALDNISKHKYNDIGSALKGLGRTIQTDLVVPLGEKLQPAVEGLIDYFNSHKDSINKAMSELVDNIGKFVDFVVNNAPAITGMIAGIGAAFLTWKVGTMILGVVGAVQALMKAEQALTVVQALLNVVTFSNPMLLLVAAIVGAVVAFGVFIATNDKLRAKIAEVWNAITQWIGNAVTSIGSMLSSWGQSIGSWFSSLWDGMVQWVSQAWTNIGNAVTVGLMLIGSLMSAFFTLITIPFRFIWENCKQIIIPIWQSIVSYLTGVWNSLCSGAISIWNNITSGIGSAVNGIKGVVSSAWDIIKSLTLIAFNAVAGVALSAWNRVKGIITPIVSAVSSAVTSGWNKIKSTTSSAFNSVASTVSSVWNRVKSTISNSINGAKDAVSGAISKIKGFMKFSWSLPKLKIPHFSISGKFSMNPPSVPKMNVSWFKDGGIMMNPTVFGMNGSSLMAGGEAGPEAILPISNLRTYIKEELMGVIGGSGFDYQQFTEAFVSAINQTGMNDINFNIDGKQLAKSSAKHFENELNNIKNRKGRLGGTL